MSKKGTNSAVQKVGNTMGAAGGTIVHAVSKAGKAVGTTALAVTEHARQTALDTRSRKQQQDRATYDSKTRKVGRSFSAGEVEIVEKKVKVRIKGPSSSFGVESSKKYKEDE